MTLLSIRQKYTGKPAYLQKNFAELEFGRANKASLKNFHTPQLGMYNKIELTQVSCHYRDMERESMRTKK
jgi:hypothetical protein